VTLVFKEFRALQVKLVQRGMTAMLVLAVIRDPKVFKARRVMMVLKVLLVRRGTRAIRVTLV
jgi:hypothetical protein